MKTKTKAALAAILLFTIIGAFALTIGNFSIPTQTLTSLSQIYVDPQGNQDAAGKWSGSYWNLQITVTANDDIAGVILPKDQTNAVTFNGATTALKTGAKIEVKIDPQQPYLTRSLIEKTVQITPETYRTYLNKGTIVDYGKNTGVKANALWLNYYEWAEPTWRIYTPYTITILKDGVQVGQATLNMEGQNQVQTIQTTEGTVRIENLGIITGQYLSPNTPAQIAIFKGYPNMYDYTQINTILPYDNPKTYNPMGSTSPYGGTIINPNLVALGQSNAYSAYWFGSARWTNDKSPAGIYVAGAIVVTGTNVGGWKNTDTTTTYQRDPITPVIGSSDKAALPEDKRNYMSLTEYIQSKNVQNLAETIFRAGSVFQKVSFQTDTNGQTALKLDIPWSAYGTPQVSIRIPTELADTFVDRPIITNTKISAAWETTGNKYSDILGNSRIKVTLTNQGTVTGSSRITIQSSNSKLAVTPLEQTVNNLAPGTAQTIYFDAANLGVQQQNSDIPITVSAYETYGGSLTGQDTIYGTLLPTLTQGQTTLKIAAYEKDTTTAIPGLQINLIYPASGQGQTAQIFTGTDGKATYSLTTPQGGAYTGTAALQTVQTDKYFDTYQTLTINNPTIYEVTLEVEVKGQTYNELDLNTILIIAGIIAVICIIIAVAIYIKRR